MKVKPIPTKLKSGQKVLLTIFKTTSALRAVSLWAFLDQHREQHVPFNIPGKDVRILLDNVGCGSLDLHDHRVSIRGLVL